ncbi:MAG: AtpZ/AtpI family protein [Lachnospiraceae bacterium]|nr:AtpZ/AtpI family protein [Lachnospiraceae bacterium]
MKYNKKVFQSLSLISQFGITMLVPIFLCSIVGWYIDEKIGTSYWFVVLFFVGALAGFRNIYILARKIYQDKDEDEER